MSDSIINPETDFIFCCLLDGSNENTILEKFFILWEKQPTASILIKSIIKELNKKYPGVNMISLYFSNFLYKKAFGTVHSERYIEINDEVEFNENQIILLREFPIYFKITNVLKVHSISSILEKFLMP